MGRRQRVSDKVDLESEKWARDKVIEYNEESERISVEMLTELAFAEREKAKDENKEGWDRFKSNKKWDKPYGKKIAAYDPHFPPGKDKLQHIVNVWIAERAAIRNPTDGIILGDPVKSIDRHLSKRLRKNRVGLNAAVVRMLFHGTGRWKKGDFIRHYALRRSLVALPTEYWMSSKAVPTIKRMTFDLLVEHVNVWGIERLDDISKNQKKLWNTQDFKKLEGWAEKIVSGAGSDPERR